MPSSVVRFMLYDPVKQRLRIKFVSGLVYEYLNVPEQEYEAMRHAGSKGIYLNKFIKGHYDFKKL